MNGSTVVTNQAITQPDKAAGVVAQPATSIAANIHKYVNDSLAREPRTTNGIALTLGLTDGANLVFAHRTTSGWEIDAYIGTKWDGSSLRAGATVLKRW